MRATIAFGATHGTVWTPRIMEGMMPRILLTLCLVGIGGCAGNQPFARPWDNPVARSTRLASTNRATTDSVGAKSEVVNAQPRTLAAEPIQDLSPRISDEKSATSRHSLVAFQRSEVADIAVADIQLQEPPAIALQAPDMPLAAVQPLPIEPTFAALQADSVELNLPSVLAMIDGQNPAVGLAQWRVKEAYARLAQAEVLWLPSIQAGFSFHRHDGNYQTSSGSIVDVNRNSFQYGLGTGATGAGTTPRPGLVAQFHLADAIFQPKIAEKTAWARGHAARAVVNERLLNAASAYIALIDAHQDSRILEDSQIRTAELAKITSDFSAAGEGLQADADRLQTEARLVENRILGAQERIAMASARLAQAISLDGGCLITPMDVTVLPLDLVSTGADLASLIGTGLATRPELKESQALVAAACDAYRREKYSPFVPSVLLGLSTGGFGGGTGNDLSNIDSRYDFDALMSWEVRNLGFGEQATRRAASARIQQAKFEKVQVLDQVARQVSEAYAQVQFRNAQIAITQQAIQSAQKSYELNLARIRDGQGLPLEVLQSVQALETARRAYLRAVVDHNQSQFQLQWSLGWPVSAPESVSSIE